MFESKSYRNAILLLLGGLLCVYGYWLTLIHPGLLPLDSDESFYYLNARNFIENSTLRAALTYTGAGAPLFQADAHGFAYPLLHGIIGSLTGATTTTTTIPVTNCAFIILSLLLIFTRKSLVAAQKATIAVMLLAFITVPYYTFSFMQESLNLFFSVCCTLLLGTMYDTKRQRDVYLFLAFLAFAALFRPLWLFWAIGLLPLAKERKQLMQFTMIFLFCAALSFVYVQQLNDHFPSYVSSVIDLLRTGKVTEAALAMGHNISTNISAYLTGMQASPYPWYYASKLVLILCAAALVWRAWTAQDRLYTAAALIALMNFVLLLVMYKVWHWREIRSMSSLFVLFTIVVVGKKERFMTLAGLLFVLVSFFGVFRLTTDTILDRKEMYRLYSIKAPFAAPPQQLLDRLDTHPAPLLLFGYTPSDYTPDLLFLPLRTPKGKPVRYAINYYGNKVQRSDYDYLINRSDASVTDATLQPILKMVYFTLYKPVAGQPQTSTTGIRSNE